MRGARHFLQCRRAEDCDAQGNFPRAWARAKSGLPSDTKEAQLSREEPRQDLLARDVQLVACRDSAGRDSDALDWDDLGAAGRDSDGRGLDLGLACRDSAYQEASRLIELGATNAMRAATQQALERLLRLCAHLHDAGRHCRASARGFAAHVDVALPWPAQHVDVPSRESVPWTRKSR